MTHSKYSWMSQEQIDSEKKEKARLRRKGIKRDLEIRTPFKEGDILSRAAFESGGVKLSYRFKEPKGLNGGCGTLTHITGTNDGKMPCGSFLTMFGKREPYYCGHCQPSAQYQQENIS